MLPHLLVLNILMSIQTWLCPLLSLKVQTLLQSLFLLLLLLLLCFLLLLLIVVLLPAAAAAARHACCVCVSFFCVIHNADASSTDIDPHASGRSPQTSRICSGAYSSNSSDGGGGSVPPPSSSSSASSSMRGSPSGTSVV